MGDEDGHPEVGHRVNRRERVQSASKCNWKFSVAPPIRTLLMQLVRFQKSKVVEYKHNVLLKSCLPVQICTNATNGGCLRFVLHRKTAIGRESHLYTNSGMMQIAREVQIRAKSQITRDGGSVCNHKSREMADPYVIMSRERWRDPCVITNRER